VEMGSGDGDVVGASHSESASREMALRRCLRMREVAVAGEGCEEGKEEMVEDEDEETELEDMMATWLFS